MISVSIGWTAWLVILTVAPNQTANYLMGTTELDDGNFWLIIDPEPVFMIVSVLCLGAFLLSYVNVLLKMTVRRDSPCTPSIIYRVVLARLFQLSSKISPQLRGAQKSLEFWNDLNNFEGRRRKLFNVLNKSLDLTIQLAALYRLLDDGVPTMLCYTYAALVAANSLSCASFILAPGIHSAFSEVFVDTIFDMLFAVVWPIWWLWYSHMNFDFDRAKALLYVSMCPSAWFERQARRMANSSEVTLFLISFDALRMKSGLDLSIRMAMNLSFSHRLGRVVEFMILQQRQKTASKQPLTDQLNIRRPTALLFVFVSVGVLVYTNQSIVTSVKTCCAYPECVAYAYRWSETEFCPCRALIDVDKAPRSYAEWMNPLNVTHLLRDLSLTGDLRVIEVVNRHLPTLPDELQRCTQLQSITLAYTGIEVVPDWSTALTKLEYLSIEGRSIDKNLVALPDQLFDKMQSLTFLHLGIHQNLATFPLMTGPSNLKMFSLALLVSLEEIPSLESLHKLKSVLLTGDVALLRVPNLSPSVTTLVILDAAACCNGYIGPCNHMRCSSPCLDTKDPQNQPSNAATQQLLDTVGVATCQFPGTPSDLLVASTREQIDECNGVMYKQCATGMCYNLRMQVIACQSEELHEAVRRREIQLGIGQPCDAKVEKWLGCQ
ncbi:hypothetical protein PR003_g16326 [Phytophthora rubi]|uniref:WLGC domain-containing protein n=1 Tax=Phytophthora rubi TaxID=129364 RepID=A0A6A4EQH8_9STRA|nr:hypothetical protein PR002_g16022 [Phytophthora rubi]KAE9013020.1 hypothetical protein PR001_g15508 [Phytophthora rubi]KAE9326025.1 hypothetical protein PR003_g16326 [Phytophthora rubi]